jgi:putative transcriptional regulator
MIIIKLDDLIWHNKTTAEEISKQTGLGSSTISKLRNSKNLNISLNTINKLCKYFNCKVSDLLEYTPD